MNQLQIIMNMLLWIVIIGLIIAFFQVNRLSGQVGMLNQNLRTVDRLQKALIFTLYDKRKNEIGERLIEVPELEEGIRIVSGMKRPDKDTPYEDLAKILGEDMQLWDEKILQREWLEYEAKEKKRKEYFSEVRKRLTHLDLPEWAIWRMWGDKMEIAEKSANEVLVHRDLIEEMQRNAKKN